MSSPTSTRAAHLLENLTSITARLTSLSTTYAQPVRIVLVSKLKPASDILALHTTSPLAIGTGSSSPEPPSHFGENYLQELLEKARELPPSIKWHFIGGLQSNKCKQLASSIPNLWSVDSVDTAKKADLLDKGRAALEEESGESGQPLRVKIQVNTSGEDTKSGVEPSDALALCRHISSSCPHLKLSGLMTIGSIARSKASTPETENEDFACLVETRDKVAQGLGIPKEDLELSMGMSADWEAAVAHGSNEVRVGSTIFGERPLKK